MVHMYNCFSASALGRCFESGIGFNFDMKFRTSSVEKVLSFVTHSLREPLPQNLALVVEHITLSGQENLALTAFPNRVD